MTLGKNPLKTLWEKQKVLVTGIIPKASFNFLVQQILLSASASNLDQSKILSFGAVKPSQSSVVKVLTKSILKT